MATGVMFVICKQIVNKYESGRYKGSISEKDLPSEAQVLIPKVAVLDVDSQGVATIVQQLTPSIYKKIGVVYDNMLLTYEDAKLLKVEPGSAVHKALKEWKQSHPSIEDLCKGPVEEDPYW